MSLLAQQPPLARAGSVEYEKRVNTYALHRKAGMPEGWYESYTSRNEQFFTSTSTLHFQSGKSLYLPNDTRATIKMISSADPFPFAGQHSSVYTDLGNGQRVSVQPFYGTDVAISDSIPPIKWKLTDEFREVAGYSCRRANGLLMDSIYVVAFYTNDIRHSGGPESFSGLPGMILEVFLPHYNVSWKALGVNASPPPQGMIIPPVSKAKPMDRRQLREWVEKRMTHVNATLRELLITGLLI